MGSSIVLYKGHFCYRVVKVKNGKGEAAAEPGE